VRLANRPGRVRITRRRRFSDRLQLAQAVGATAGRLKRHPSFRADSDRPESALERRSPCWCGTFGEGLSGKGFKDLPDLVERNCVLGRERCDHWSAVGHHLHEALGFENLLAIRFGAHMSTLFIGLGAMGAPMATDLARGDEPVVVFDVNTEAAYRLADTVDVSVAESLDPLPDGVSTLILMVPNSRIVEDLLTGSGALLERLPVDALVIDMSSPEPSGTRRLAEVAAQQGTAHVDAPVSGGVPRAQTGELAIMAGGDTDAVERARPTLCPVGTSVYHVGGPGAGDAARHCSPPTRSDTPAPPATPGSTARTAPPCSCPSTPRKPSRPCRAC
jgi:hypothetical protein